MLMSLHLQLAFTAAQQLPKLFYTCSTPSDSRLQTGSDVCCSTSTPRLGKHSLTEDNTCGLRPKHDTCLTGAASKGRSKSSGGGPKEKMLESLACLERFYGIKQLADNRQSMAPIEFR